MRVIRKKEAWDFEILIIEKLLNNNYGAEEIYKLKIELFNALLHLNKYIDIIKLGEKILSEYYYTKKLTPGDIEFLVSNIIIACLERGKIEGNLFEKSKDILQKYTIINPSYEFKIGIEAEVYIHNELHQKCP